MNWDRKYLELYAVTGEAVRGSRTRYEQVEAALRGGATMVQLRDKALDGAALLREAVALKALCSRYGVPLIVNDSADLALAAGADGVHIGQRDGDAAEIRRRLGPDMILGVTAHTVGEALAAERAGADYLGAGAVFPTGTKADTTALPMETLREICASVSIPVVAIGGVTKENVGRLSGSGVTGVAVVGAIFSAEDAERAAAELRETLTKTRTRRDTQQAPG